MIYEMIIVIKILYLNVLDSDTTKLYSATNIPSINISNLQQDLSQEIIDRTNSDEVIQEQVTDIEVELVINEDCDELYQLAADMGGAGYIFTGQNDANVMHNSLLINLNVMHECTKKNVKKVC